MPGKMAWAALAGGSASAVGGYDAYLLATNSPARAACSARETYSCLAIGPATEMRCTVQEVSRVCLTEFALHLGEIVSVMPVYLFSARGVLSLPSVPGCPLISYAYLLEG